ncbi:MULTISPECIES: hypothetical protein [Streptosporangiaceae]|uniref:hypothetical protein n=1 Tax=Streptosporangiaceae TaxID=2004 RepID=UPI0033D29707
MAEEETADDRPEFLAELKDMYGYPVTLMNSPSADQDAVLLAIGSGIHNQNAFARLAEDEVRAIRDALTVWLDTPWEER